MARKFLQMGFTRARRYANYKGGKKYNSNGGELMRGTGEDIKAESAAIFYSKWQQAERNRVYKKLKTLWKESIG